MASIELPSRSTGQRRRGAVSRRQASQEVPDAPLARDPGLRVPVIDQGAGLIDAGQRISKMGAEMAAASEKLASAHRKAAVAAATARARAELRGWRLEKEQDPDYGSYESEIETEIDRIEDFHVQGLDDEGAAQFRLNFLQDSLEESHLLKKAGLQHAEDQTKAEYQTAEDMNLTDASRLPPGPARDKIIANQRKSIVDAVEDGVYTAVEGQNRMDVWLGKMEEATAREMIIGDAEAAANALADPEQFRKIDPVQRIQLFGMAARQAEAQRKEALRKEEKAEKAAEEQRKAAQDEREAIRFDDILEGRAGDAELERDFQSGLIRPEQFITLRRVLEAQQTGDAAEDNPSTLIALNQRLDDGTLTKPDVYDAFANKEITKTSMNKFLGDIDSDIDANVSKHRRALREALGNEAGQFATYGADVISIIQDGEQEYDRRVEAGEDPFTVFQDIKSRGAPVRGEPGSFLRPRFLSNAEGNPVADNAAMDPEQTEKATYLNFVLGKISFETYREEIQLIRQIARTLETE